MNISQNACSSLYSRIKFKNNTPDLATGLLHHAQIAYAKQDWRAASELFRLAWNQPADNLLPQHYAKFTGSLLKQQQIDEAENILNQGMNQYPQHLLLQIQNAELTMAKQDWSNAMKLWNSFLPISIK